MQIPLASQEGNASAPVGPLVQQLCAGEEAAWAELWDRYAGTMLGAARGLIRRHHWTVLDEEDVLSEHFLRLATGIRKFEGSSLGQLEAFMRRDVFYTCQDLLRKLGQIWPDLPEDFDPPDPRHRDDVVLCEHMLREAIWALPRDLADVVLLNLRGHESEMIASLRSIKRTTVFDRKHRALRLLHERLEGQDFWQQCEAHLGELRVFREGERDAA